MRYFVLAFFVLISTQSYANSSSTENTYFIECWGEITHASDKIERVYTELKKDGYEVKFHNSKILVKHEAFQSFGDTSLDAAQFNNHLADTALNIEKKLGSAYKGITFQMKGCRSSQLSNSKTQNEREPNIQNKAKSSSGAK